MEHEKPGTGFTLKLAFATISCVVGSSFQYGYNTALLNAPEELVKRFINETHETRNNETISIELLTITWSLVSSGFGIGAMVGSLLAAPLARHLGSKKSLFINNIFALLGSITSVLCRVFGYVEILIVGRLFVGINSGLNCVVVPMYLTEISTISTRGTLGAGHQIGIAISVIIANILGLDLVLGTEELWHFLFVGISAFAVFQLFTLPFCPESPRFLMISKKDQPAAEKALQWLRDKQDVSDDIEEMKIELRELQTLKKFTMIDLVRNSDLRRPMILCTMMHLSQQLSGVAAFALYSTSIFVQTLNDVQTSTYLAVGLSTFGMIMCVVFAGVIERSGRRPLHIIGCAGMAGSMALMTVCYIFGKDIAWLSYGAIVGVFLYVFCFNIGPGSIPWFIVAEMFTQGSKSSAMTVAVFFNSLSSFVVSFAFPDVQEFIEDYSFLPFVGLLVIFCIYFYFRLPETKGKTIEEVANIFRSKKTKAQMAMIDSWIVPKSQDTSTETLSTQL